MLNKLAEASGYEGYMPTDRCVVFLNNEFYGIFSLQPTRSKSYFASRYDLEDPDKITIIEGSESEFIWNNNLDQLFHLDLDKEENRKKLENVIDMDDWLLYFAVEILSNNVDWPNNNFAVWKYEGEYKNGNKYSDGRYRTFLYDADLIWQSKKSLIDVFGSDVFESIMEQTNSGKYSYFDELMKSKYYRERFIEIMENLLNSSYEYENIATIVEEEFAYIKEAVIEAYGEEYANNQQARVDEIISRALLHRERLFIDLKEYLFL